MACFREKRYFYPLSTGVILLSHIEHVIFYIMKGNSLYFSYCIRKNSECISYFKKTDESYRKQEDMRRIKQ